MKHLAVALVGLAWAAGPAAAAGPALAAEHETTIRRDAFLCVNWAAWHDYTLASLTPRGGRISRLCPLRLPPKTKVVLVEDDAGMGASEIRFKGETFFVDNDRLD